MFCRSDRVLSALLTGRVWYPRADVLQYKERVGVCLKRQHGGRQRADPGVLLPARLPDQLQPNPARSAFWILCVPNVRKWKQKNVKWLIQTSLPCLLFFLFCLFCFCEVRMCTVCPQSYMLHTISSHFIRCTLLVKGWTSFAFCAAFIMAYIQQGADLVENTKYWHEVAAQLFAAHPVLVTFDYSLCAHIHPIAIMSLAFCIFALISNWTGISNEMASVFSSCWWLSNDSNERNSMWSYVLIGFWSTLC